MGKKEKPQANSAPKAGKEKAANNAPKKKVSKSSIKAIQGQIPYECVYPNGIIRVSKDEFSKLYQLPDANFITEAERKQEDILVDYGKFLNRFQDNVSISIVIVNKKNPLEVLAKHFHLKEQGDNLDQYRSDYNHIVDTKINDGHNDITKDKYIILTVRTTDYPSAESLFNTLDVELSESVKKINKNGVKPVGIFERLKIMNYILRGNGRVDFDKQYERYRKDDNGVASLDAVKMKKDGCSTKDMIAPDTIKKENSGKLPDIMLGDERFCKTYMFTDLPVSLDTKFLSEITNVPCEMVTTVFLSTIPRAKAIRMVKMQNNSIKADVVKASRDAYKAGYDPSLMNEDLLNAQDEAKTLRHDVVVEGRKIFFATITTSVFADSHEDLKEFCDQFGVKCGDFTLQPNTLNGQQMAGLKSSLLLGSKFVVQDRMVTSDSACALFPFNIQEMMDKGGHFYGINAVSKNMIMYDRKNSKLANGLILGMSGSGKSFITKGEIIPNLLDGNDDVIILDPDGEYVALAQEFGGTVVTLKQKSDVHINPLDMNMEFDDPDASPIAEKCDYMVGLVESVLGNHRECNSFEVNVIHRATNKMYEDYVKKMEDRREAGEKINIDTDLCPTLEDFMEALLNDNSPEGNKIAMAMEPYCTGNYNMFAHKTNIKGQPKFLVYNLKYMPEKMKEMAMKVCLANIWTRVVENQEANRRNHTSKYIWVYMDEFYLFMQTEGSATTIQVYYKRIRKYGGIMTGITQDIADLLRTPQGQGMYNNTGFFLIMNQSPLGRAEIQRQFEVSDALIDYIKDKPPGMGLFYNNTTLIPFDYHLPNDTKLYKLMTTRPADDSDTTSVPVKKEEEKAEAKA